MINRERPHLTILPEDDANRQIANGFLNNKRIDDRRCEVLRPAGGWVKVRDCFERDWIDVMRMYPEKRLLLCIDFDSRQDRLNVFAEIIPSNLKERVFVIGVYSEPERLRQKANMTYENLGYQLAEECHGNHSELWNLELLKHNQPVLARLRLDIHTFLFQ